MRDIIIEDFCDEDDSWIVGGIIVSFSKLFLAPIEKPSDERRDQEEAMMSAGYGLDHVEDEGHISFDA